MNKPYLGNNSGGGNLIAYNYQDNAYIDAAPGWQETGLDAAHQAFAHSDLFEGNWATNLSADSTHGNTGFHVFFRNYAHGRNTSPPVPDNANLAAVGLGRYAREHTFIANVLNQTGTGIVYEANPFQNTDVSVPAIYRLGHASLGGSFENWDGGTAAVRVYRHGNPLRAEELAAGRQEKVQTIEKLLTEQNAYLTEHPRATVAAALRRVQTKITHLRLSPCLSVTCAERTLTLVRDEAAWQELSKLDGCYCLKTDLPAEQAAKELVHDRYKDLADVEWAFRTSKSTLEVRPVFVRKESRTRGHVFVVMLAYQIIKELADCWRDLDLTPCEGVQELTSLCMTEVTIAGQTTINQIPTPRDSVQALLTAARVELPPLLPYSGTKVYTKKKLTAERQPK